MNTVVHCNLLFGRGSKREGGEGAARHEGLTISHGVPLPGAPVALLSWSLCEPG